MVDLYTSQGCSSRPPADFLLGQLTRQSGILALSFYVNYWDYISWKDPYGSAGNTRRQRAYKKTFNRSYVYTPQMVGGGMLEVTGSDASAAKDGIRQASLAERTDRPCPGCVRRFENYGQRLGEAGAIGDLAGFV